MTKQTRATELTDWVTLASGQCQWHEINYSYSRERLTSVRCELDADNNAEGLCEHHVKRRVGRWDAITMDPPKTRRAPTPCRLDPGDESFAPDEPGCDGPDRGLNGREHGAPEACTPAKPHRSICLLQAADHKRLCEYHLTGWWLGYPLGTKLT